MKRSGGTVNEYKVSLWGNENAQELIKMMACTTLVNV